MSAANVAAAVAAAEDAGDDNMANAPEPLPSGIPPVPALPSDMLPARIRPWIADVAERMQCPPEYPAVAAICAAGALIGRTVTIRPKCQDDWAVVPNLWGAVVGRPGVLKSPAMREALRPVAWLEQTAAEAYAEALKEHKAEAVLREQEKSVCLGKIRKHIKDGDLRAARELASGSDEAPVPVRRRRMVNDATVEKLGEILRDNPRGVLVFRDELAGFLRSMEREGREADRAFYLEAWQGDGRFAYDRIGRGTVDIEACCVSILGSIQPGPLAAYLAAAARGGIGDDGLVQRFQLTVWPDIARSWRNCDRWPSADAKALYQQAFYDLDNLRPDRIGASVEDDCLPYFRFDPLAQEVFDVWRHQIEARLRAGDLLPTFEAHLAKYRSLVPSLALIFHLLDGGSGPVGQAALSLAMRWAEFLEAHARRLYSTVIAGDVHAARALAKRIRTRDVQSPFTPRQVRRHGWELLGSREDVEAAIQVLAEHRWITLATEQNPHGGRPSTVCHIDPRAYELAGEL